MNLRRTRGRTFMWRSGDKAESAVKMKIKQQKQIKEFLVESFGNDRGGKLFEMQDKVLGDIIGNTKGKTENQMKTLIQTILPRIALYKSLQAEGLSDDDVYKYMRKYMLEIVAAKTAAIFICLGSRGSRTI